MTSSHGISFVVMVSWIQSPQSLKTWSMPGPDRPDAGALGDGVVHAAAAGSAHEAPVLGDDLGWNPSNIEWRLGLPDMARGPVL